MVILGIGGLLGGAAVAALKDGRIAAAIEEAKLNRGAEAPRAGELPTRAIAACLQLAGASPEDVDCVALVRRVPQSDFHLKVRARFPNSRIVVLGHHHAHAASAYYPSPFDEATVLAMDRGGDLRSFSRWCARGTSLVSETEQFVPDSFGDIYARVTELLGFQAQVDEHKTQWLSVSGKPVYAELFANIFGGCKDGPRIDRSYLSTQRLGEGGFGARFYSELGLKEGAAIPEEMRADLAASAQKALEQAVIRVAGEGSNLCLAGGVALNTLLVATLECASGYRNVFVQPAAGNAGTAIGAVLHAWHAVYGNTARVPLETMALGPSYTAAEVKPVLENCKLRFQYLLTTEEVIEKAVAQLNENRIVAWMHGRMEFGGRALGNRSILASPLDPYSTENLNIFIKHREPFRKFAASVPAELAPEYFEVGPNARFLSTVGRVKPHYREQFSAAVLAGDMVRVHTVDRAENPLYWRLLHAAGKSTGLPVLYNTSFNLFGEPLVCTPRDAVRSFYSSGIDAMFVGQFFLQK